VNFKTYQSDLLSTLDLYYDAVTFERAVDDHMIDIIGMERIYGTIPRAAQHYKVIRSFGLIPKCLIQAGAYAFFFAIYPIFLVKKILTSACSSRAQMPGPVKVLYIGTSTIYDWAQIQSFPLSMKPVALVKNISDSSPADYQTVSCRSIVRASDIVRSVIFSVAAVAVLLVKDRKNLVFSYSAYEFFLWKCAVERLAPQQIIFGNQLDRWLVLWTRIKADERYLVQHGDIAYPESVGSQSIFEFSPKIKGLTDLCLYDIDQKEGFERFIDLSGTEIRNFKRSISVSRSAADSPTILIVGAPGPLGPYEELIMKITQNKMNNWKIYIRHHPIQRKRLSKSVAKLVAAELNSNDELPCVTHVLTYGSSLDSLIKRNMPEVVFLSFEPHKITAIDSVMLNLTGAISDGL
jgi:hypothetical protein